MKEDVKEGFSRVVRVNERAFERREAEISHPISAYEAIYQTAEGIISNIEERVAAADAAREEGIEGHEGYRGIAVETPFGTTTVTPRKTGSVMQLMVSTNRDNYPDSSSFAGNAWATYATWAVILDGDRPQENAKHLLSALGDEAYSSEEILSVDEKRALASMWTTLLTSEEYRVDGVRKMARGAVREICNNPAEHNFTNTFGAGDASFTMARTGGTVMTREGIENPFSITSEVQRTLAQHGVCLSPTSEMFSSADVSPDRTPPPGRDSSAKSSPRRMG